MTCAVDTAWQKRGFDSLSGWPDFFSLFSRKWELISNEFIRPLPSLCTNFARGGGLQDIRFS